MNQGYNYICPYCKKSNITFLEIIEEGVVLKISFLCNIDGQKFEVEDKERGYIHNKKVSLRERYPPDEKAEAS